MKKHFGVIIRVIAIVCMVFCSIVCVAQGRGGGMPGTDDSTTANALSDQAFEAAERNADSGLMYARAGIAIARRCGNEASVGNCLNAMGWAFFKAGNMDSAKRCTELARSIFGRQGSRRRQARSMMNLGYMYIAEGRLDTALGLLMAMQRLLGPGEVEERAVGEKIMGVIYRRMGNNEKAKKYLTDAAANFRKIGEQKQYADVLGSIGIIFLAEEDFEPALGYFREALVIYKATGNASGAALMYDDIGHVYRVKGKSSPRPWLDSALHYYGRALDEFTRAGSKMDIPHEYLGMGEALALKGDHGGAERSYKMALEGFRALHDVANVHNVLVSLSQLFAGRQDHRRAYQYLEQAYNYYDTLQQQKKDREVADVLEKYESGKKDSLITLLNANNALLHTQARLAQNNLYKSRVIGAFAAVAALLAAALGLVLWNRYRMKQQLAAVQMRNRISNDLHDDVGSSLSSILLLSNLAEMNAGSRPEIISKISATARDVVERISDIVWTTNPKYDDGESLRTKVIKYGVFLSHVHGVETTVSVGEEIMELKLPMEVRRNVFLLVKEAVNNMLKHAGASRAAISLHVKEKQLMLEIEDNGRGFDMASVARGNGLDSMRQRVESAKGKLTINSTPGKGTKLTAVIPVRAVGERAR